MLEALRQLSAKIGADPLLVQAAGGNTSLKQDGVMWIKASGTWLRDAQARDIFVPLDLARLQVALDADDPACESCTDFVVNAQSLGGLRPSIETSVHGLMPQAVVVHVHCVNTIAWAILQDAEQQLATRLHAFNWAPHAFNWAYVPYARPGLQLCRAIKKAKRPNTNVLVLGNHGLVVGAETVADAEQLLDKVVAAVQRPAQDARQLDLEALTKIAAGTNYQLPKDPTCHGFAMDAANCARAANAVYYPDHVVFLGQHLPATLDTDAAAVALPELGVLVRKDAKPSVEPMLACLSNVFARIDADEKLNPLTLQDIGALLNWDAEKYRQNLKK
jgi:rhamnose utilization protein RhaD (predicted bifunctional aldolase and dehydrogenase)